MIARKAKFDKERVLNTKTADEFEAWLMKNRRGAVDAE